MNLISFSDRLSKFLMVLAAVWAFGLTFMILADIIGRGVFDCPDQRHRRTGDRVYRDHRVPAGRICHSKSLHVAG